MVKFENNSIAITIKCGIGQAEIARKFYVYGNTFSTFSMNLYGSTDGQYLVLGAKIRFSRSAVAIGLENKDFLGAGKVDVTDVASLVILVGNLALEATTFNKNTADGIGQ